jgi:putative hydrolase of the HAD superfamily
MIPIFDLDDTLYPERSFVESGFRAVAIDLEQIFGWSFEESLKHMMKTLSEIGRGSVFNRLLDSHGALNQKLVKHCIKTYRHHQPNIKMVPEAHRILDSFTTRPYLVTDGHKEVQSNKIKALNLQSRFSRIYITRRYGMRYEKPSIHCFELIRKRERCAWSEMFYIGDNPEKDFVNLNPLGVQTIRVITGEHSAVVAKDGFDAKYQIASLDQLDKLLLKIFK